MGVAVVSDPVGIPWGVPPVGSMSLTGGSPYGLQDGPRVGERCRAMAYDDCVLADFTVSARVESHPATDAWIMGDRYGTVVKVGRKLVHVKMDRSGRVRRFAPRNLLTVS